MQADNDKQAQTIAQDARQPWVTPQVARIKAGEAELGANPINPEGVLGAGS